MGRNHSAVRIAHFAFGVSLLLTFSARAADAQPIEGFGSISKGGAGGETYHVTNLKDNGSGSLRHGLNTRSQMPLTIVFDVGGTIVLKGDIVINQPFLTIDGSSAPSPGITIRQDTFNDSFIVAGTHDVILKSLRFQGLFVDGGPNGGNNPLLIIDGDSKPDFVAQRIVFDHITVAKAGDSGPDIWADVRDVTIQWSFFYASLHPTTVSATPGANMVRQRISMHHNVYAVNGERNPQLRGDVRTFDYVNNIVYGWGSMPQSNVNSGYGILVRNEPGEPQVNGVNVVNNAFVAIPNLYSAWGLVYGDKPGRGPGRRRTGGAAAAGRRVQGRPHGRPLGLGQHPPQGEQGSLLDREPARPGLEARHHLAGDAAQGPGHPRRGNPVPDRWRAEAPGQDRRGAVGRARATRAADAGRVMPSRSPRPRSCRSRVAVPEAPSGRASRTEG